MLSKDPRQTKGLMDSFDTYAGHRSAVHLLHWLQVLLHHGLSGLDLQQRAHVPKIDIYIYSLYNEGAHTSSKVQSDLRVQFKIIVKIICKFIHSNK